MQLTMVYRLISGDLDYFRYFNGGESKYFYDHGELSNSQKRAIITLIAKKKDRSDIANWRPISLIDVKIGSETITKRLETVLPSIIYHNQCAYVKDRTISDAARSLATNVLISKIGKISSPAWSFRGDAEESLQLIFAPCPFTKKL